jgi:hypothetical protein
VKQIRDDNVNAPTPPDGTAEITELRAWSTTPRAFATRACEHRGDGSSPARRDNEQGQFNVPARSFPKNSLADPSVLLPTRDH